MSSKICAHVCINETPFQAVRQPTVDVSLSFANDSRWTKQCFKDEADVNTIMARYLSTGELPVVSDRIPQYLDVTGLDYQEMQNQVVQANHLFAELPSVLRNRFQNDPGLFIEYCQDESNHDEMRKLGLLRLQESDRGVGAPPIAPKASSDSGSGEA